MNYLRLISRTRQDENKTKCKHGLEEKICFYCNGDFYKQKTVTKKQDENYELRIKYEKLKKTFKNFRELWTEDEICIVYDDFKTISKKEVAKISYLTAIKLERTRKAVIWMFLHIFSDKKNLHRGKEVMKFREKLQIK